VDSKKLALVTEYEFEAGADAPMSMAYGDNCQSIVSGVNETPEKIEKGTNAHCRVLTLKDDKFKLEGAQQISHSVMADDYQKVSAVSSALSMAAIGSTDNEIHLLNFPSLSPVSKSIKLEGELFDATFGAATLVAVSSTQITVYTIPALSTSNGAPGKPTQSTLSKGKAKDAVSLPTLELVKALEKPQLPSLAQGSTVSFRAARYHPDDWTQLFTVLNTSPARGTRGKRGAYVVRWNTKSWEIAKSKKIADAGITCMDISPHGKYLAYALSDCSIGILDSQTFAPLLSILKAHEFPATTLRFNPTGTMLVSASADNSVEVVTVPEKFNESWNFLFLVIFSLLAVSLAILYQMYERS